MTAHAGTAAGPDAPSVGLTRRDVLGIVVLYMGAVALYAVLGHRQALPIVSPDEFTYGHLARSLADGQGLTWRGEHVALHSALYVFAIAPAWLVDNTITAYGLTKLVGAVLLCSVVVPVWLLARQVVAPRTSLVVAALSVAGTWMTTAGLVLTENLALPLTTGSLAAAAMALRRPGSRWGWLALALALVAAWARFQLLLLVPVIALALLADVARSADRRAALRAHRPVLLAVGGLLAAGVVIAVADFGALAGVYDGAADFSLSASVVAAAIGKSWLALMAMAGFIPVVVAVTLATSRRAWRDAGAGPLLCLLIPGIVVFVAVSGWATAGYRVTWPIQRYVEYALPLAFVLLGVAAERPALLPRRTWIVALLLAAGALLATAAEPLEGRAAYALQTGARQLLGASPGAGLALAAVVVSLAGVALLLAPRRPTGAWWVLGLTMLVVALQAQAGWRWQLDRADEWRSGFPADLRAVDHAARGPVARVFLTTSHPRFETVEFFNRDVTREFVPPTAAGNGRVLRGKRCEWTVLRSGVARYQPGCGPDPAHLYLDDPSAVLTYVGQHDVRRIRGLGRLVDVPGPPGPTRLRSIAVLPCDDPTLVLPSGRVLGFAPRRCRVGFSALLWLDRPATLAVGVRGGAQEHTATVGGQVFRIPPRRITTIRVLAPKGRSRLDLRFDRQELPAGLPDVASAVLVDGGRRQSIL